MANSADILAGQHEGRVLCLWAHAAVAEVEPDDKLLENPARLRLRQPCTLVPQYIAEQVSALSVLHRNGKVGTRKKDLRGDIAVLIRQDTCCTPAD